MAVEQSYRPDDLGDWLGGGGTSSRDDKVDVGGGTFSFASNALGDPDEVSYVVVCLQVRR